MSYPIGVIDSGKGGIGLIHYLSFSLNNEDFLFYQDKENFPYGRKSREEIISIGDKAIVKLIQYNPKLIIIACNTLGCNYTPSVSKKVFKINEIIMKEIKQKVKKESVLILSTERTLKSGYFQKECERNCIEAEVKACPYLVEAVEYNKINKNKIQDYLFKLYDKDYGYIVLGCTHFYYLEEIIKDTFKNKVKIIKGYSLLEKSIKKYLRKNKLRNKKDINGEIRII